MDTDQVTNTAKNLSTGNKILGGSAAAALVAVNLSWYTFDNPFLDTVGIAGRRMTFGWMGILLLLGAAGLVLAPAFGGKEVKTDGLATEQIALGAAGLGTLLWLFRLVSVPGFGAYQRGFGLYIAIAAAAGVVYGVVASMKEKGIAMPTAADLKSVTSGNQNSPMAPAPSNAAVQPAPAVPVHTAPVVHPAPTAAPVHPAPTAAPVVHPAPTAAPAHQPPAAPTATEF